jgi:adenylate kinase family enzyme
MSAAATQLHPPLVADSSNDAPTPVSEMLELSANEAALARVRLLARRRLAWLEHLGKSGAQTSDVASVLEDRDHPESEQRWASTDPRSCALQRKIAALSAALADDEQSPLARIVRNFALSDAERDLLHLCLALELEPSLGPVYSVLQGQAGRGATAALAARLCQFAREPQVSPSGPLLRWQLVRSVEGAAGEPASLRLDPHVLDFACGRFTLDPELLGVAAPVEALEPLPGWPVAEVVQRCSRALAEGVALRVTVKGPRGSGRRTFAAAIARELGCSVLAIDTSTVTDSDWPELYRHAQRQALLLGLLLAWHGDGLGRRWPGVPAVAPLQFVIGETDVALKAAPGFVEEQVTLPRPGVDARAALFRRFVPAAQTWPAAELSEVAERYQVEVGDIVGLRQRGVDSLARTRELCRAATRDRLGELAQLIDCPFRRDDLVLVPSVRERLDELLFEAMERSRFWEGAAAQRLFSRSTGLVALLTGSPGTGKTMAAQVIAAELGLDLFRIDLSTSISKYIGETAKHLRRIFQRAAEMNAVLLFDEADALFSKRTDVKDSHDRYANTDTNYLLQLIEDFSGIALLSSNKKQNMDTAFLRRIRYVLDFPRPSAPERLVLWRRFVAELAGAEVAQQLDAGLCQLAEVADVSGAQIKLSVLVALFLSRQDGKPIALVHLVRGVSRELAKEGRGISPAERERLGLRG